MELEDLYDRCRELEEQKANFFNDDDSPNYGDRGYQDLCERISDISQRISDIEEDFDENLEVVDKSILEMEEAQDSLGEHYYDNGEDFNFETDITMEDCN